MANEPTADTTVRVTVRLPRDVAEALEHLPNKSEFVRQAVVAQMDKTCPMCGGTGRVPARSTQQESADVTTGVKPSAEFETSPDGGTQLQSGSLGQPAPEEDGGEEVEM